MDKLDLETPSVKNDEAADLNDGNFFGKIKNDVANKHVEGMASFSPIQKMPVLERRRSHIVGIPRNQELILKMLLRP